MAHNDNDDCFGSSGVLRDRERAVICSPSEPRAITYRDISQTADPIPLTLQAE